MGRSFSKRWLKRLRLPLAASSSNLSIRMRCHTENTEKQTPKSQTSYKIKMDNNTLTEQPFWTAARTSSQVQDILHTTASEKVWQHVCHSTWQLPRSCQQPPSVHTHTTVVKLTVTVTVFNFFSCRVIFLALTRSSEISAKTIRFAGTSKLSNLRSLSLFHHAISLVRTFVHQQVVQFQPRKSQRFYCVPVNKVK